MWRYVFNLNIIYLYHTKNDKDNSENSKKVTILGSQKSQNVVV